MPWPTVIVFIDLEPTLNWGHDSRYLLVNSETGELQSIDARFPPFLCGAPDTLRVIWKAEAVPSWVVATDQSFCRPTGGSVALEMEIPWNRVIVQPCWALLAQHV